MAATESTTTVASAPFARGDNLQHFLEAEKAAPLLNRAGGFFDAPSSETSDEFVSHVSHWPSLLVDTPGGHSAEAKAGVAVPADTQRLFRLDSVRTFASEEHREVLQRLLQRLVVEVLLGEYHQSLSLLSGLLLLSFDEETVVQIVHHLNSHPKYIPGYWRNEAVAFATDAYVMQQLIVEHVPDVGRLLLEQGLLPETYMQKWFVGLGINVLPFRHLYRFIGNFLQHGQVFLLRFGLSFVANMQDTLLSCGADHSKLLAWLRLDPELCTIDDAVIAKILDEATPERYPLDGLDVDAMRAACYDKHLRERLERARAFKEQQAAAASAAAAAKDDNDDDDGDDDEEFGCQGAAAGEDECENAPEHFLYSPSDAVILCSDCRKKQRFRGYRSHTPNDLYQLCQRPDVAKKLDDAKKMRQLAAGVQAL